MLHYESCDFNQWCAKFLNQVDCTPERKQSIPFPYYRDSISLFQQYSDPTRDLAKWMEFYQKRKIDHYKTMEIRSAARHIPVVRRPRMIDALPGTQGIGGDAPPTERDGDDRRHAAGESQGQAPVPAR